MGNEFQPEKMVDEIESFFDDFIVAVQHIFQFTDSEHTCVHCPSASHGSLHSRSNLDFGETNSCKSEPNEYIPEFWKYMTENEKQTYLEGQLALISQNVQKANQKREKEREYPESLISLDNESFQDAAEEYVLL